MNESLAPIDTALTRDQRLDYIIGPRCEIENLARDAKKLSESQAGLPFATDLKDLAVALETYLDALLNHLFALKISNHRKGLSEAEGRQLLSLNKHLRTFSEALVSYAIALNAPLAQRKADPHDPMVDYEIDGWLAFLTRRDASGGQKLVTQMSQLLTEITIEDSILTDPMNWADPPPPECLSSEPHCYMFHDLYDHSYTVDGRDLGYRGCLDIGEIRTNIEVQYQYSFELPRTAAPAGTPEL